VMTDYKFTVIMLSDTGTQYAKRKEWTYDNAVDAVNSYNAFVDHGFACCGRTIMLIEPTGILHHKTYLTRGIDDEVRDRLGYTSPVLN
jgi:energy-converting hydrogenase Eha subunit F